MPKAYRAVGNILHNYNPKAVGKIPCYRVIRADGKPGGYRWGAAQKKKYLEREGVRV